MDESVLYWLLGGNYQEGNSGTPIIKQVLSKACPNKALLIENNPSIFHKFWTL